MHAIANYLHTPPPARRRRRRSRAATTRMAPAGVAILLTFYVVKQTQRGGRDFFCMPTKLRIVSFDELSKIDHPFVF